MRVANIVVDEKKIAEAVARLERMLVPMGVVRIRHTVREDYSGEPALYLRVLLMDAAADLAGLREVTRKVEAEIERELDPMNTWDLFPYINFRKQSEQDSMQDPAWA